MGKGSEDGCGLQGNSQCLPLVGISGLRWGALRFEHGKKVSDAGLLAGGLPALFFLSQSLSHDLH